MSARLTPRERAELAEAEPRGWLLTRARWRCEAPYAWGERCRAAGRPYVCARQRSPRYADVAFEWAGRRARLSLRDEMRCLGVELSVRDRWGLGYGWASRHTVWGRISRVPLERVEACVARVLALLADPANMEPAP